MILSFQNPKDPEAVLDYVFDWTDWLEDGEEITGFEVTGTRVTVDSATESDGRITVWLSGGTARRPASVTCQVTTNMGLSGRTDQRTAHLEVRHR